MVTIAYSYGTMHVVPWIGYAMQNPTDRSKAKEVIVEIIRQSGEELRGQTRLYKAFLVAHLYYFDKNDDFLTEWPIVHMPRGHGIDDGDTLLAELVSAGQIARRTEPCGPFKEAVFELQDSAETTSLTPTEVAAIRLAVNFVNSKSASELSEIIHEHSRSYKDGKSGEPLDIYIDTFDESWLQKANERLSTIDQELRQAGFVGST